MMSKKKIKKDNLKSTCCKAEIKYSDFTPDFIGDDPKTMTTGTCCCICSKCGQQCNVMSNKRRTWTINPVERIVPNKKKKSSTKLTPKELKEIHLNEDF